MAGTEPESCKAMRQALGDLLADVRSLAKVHGWDFTPGSQADRDQSDPRYKHRLIETRFTTDFLIETAEEQFTAFIKTITPPIEPVACWTSVRGLLEPCAIAAWLLEPDVDIRIRAGRGFALSYEGIEQQLKWSIATGPGPELDNLLEAQIDELTGKAMDLGFEPVVSKKGVRIGVGQRMPGATELIKMMLDEEPIYRLTSGVAHGHLWAIRLTGYVTDPNDTDPVLFGGMQAHRLIKQPSQERMIVLGRIAARSLARAWWNQSWYYGWDHPTFRTSPAQYL